MTSTEQKKEKLITCLRSLGSVAVAFSAGVDSTFLLDAAYRALGEKAFAVTAVSCFTPESELAEAVGFCEKKGIRLIKAEIDILSVDDVASNPPDRCYKCKKAMFSLMKRVAEENGASFLAEGSNVDDESDYRPGMRAIAELKIKSPLKEAGLTKSEIRLLAKEVGLSVWNKPAYACLATRFAFGKTITKERLRSVEQAEDFLDSLGFYQRRVRVHGDIARIETDADGMTKLLDVNISKAVSQKLKSLGFSHVTVDLEGYRQGSMNFGR